MVTIQDVINYHAFKSFKYNRYLDVNDVKQDLWERLINVKDKYDSKKGAPTTFAAMVCKNECYKINRKAMKMQKTKIGCADLSYIEDERDSIKKIETKMCLDSVEKRLAKKNTRTAELAVKIFRLLRQGHTQRECGFFLKVSYQRVSQIFETYIKPIARRTLS